jgi:hypothetical protein
VPLDAGLPVSDWALKDKLGPWCKAAFIGQPIKESATQQQVSDILWGMGLSVEDEFRCPKAGDEMKEYLRAQLTFMMLIFNGQTEGCVD